MDVELQDEETHACAGQGFCMMQTVQSLVVWYEKNEDCHPKDLESLGSKRIKVRDHCDRQQTTWGTPTFFSRIPSNRVQHELSTKSDRSGPFISFTMQYSRYPFSFSSYI